MRIIADIFAYTSPADAEVQLASPSPATTCRRPGPPPTWSWPTRWPTGWSTSAPASTAGLDVDAFVPAAVVLLGDRHELLHGGRQAAGRPAAVGEAGRASSSRRTPRSCRCGRTARPRGWSLTAQDVYNNVVRTCIEAMAATQGHTQSLHTNALDEALALPTDFSARIARNTQLFLQQESGTTRVDRPVGRLLLRRAADRTTWPRRAWRAHPGGRGAGGMAKAIEAGIPKLRIEEAAARTQARIDSGRQTVDRREQVPAGRGGADRRAEGGQHGGPRPAGRRSCGGCGRSATSAVVDAALERADRRGRARDRQPAGAGDRRGPGEGHGRRDHRRAGAGLRAAQRAIRYASSGVYREEVGTAGHRRAGARPRRPRSSEARAAGRASWSPRWARTATTAARR